MLIDDCQLLIIYYLCPQINFYEEINFNHITFDDLFL